MPEVEFIFAGGKLPSHVSPQILSAWELQGYKVTDPAQLNLKLQIAPARGVLGTRQHQGPSLELQHTSYASSSFCSNATYRSNTKSLSLTPMEKHRHLKSFAVITASACFVITSPRSDYPGSCYAIKDCGQSSHLFACFTPLSKTWAYSLFKSLCNHSSFHYARLVASLWNFLLQNYLDATSLCVSKKTPNDFLKG